MFLNNFYILFCDNEMDISELVLLVEVNFLEHTATRVIEPRTYVP